MSATERFHEVANDSLVRISEHLWPGAKLALVVYEPGKPKLDIVLKDQGIDLNEVLSTLRRAGLSIDGDNAYKRDLLDSVVGSLALGAQNSNAPPAGHWGQRLWDIGREERAQTVGLLKALMKLTGVAGECEQIASNYSGTIDGVSEHGGDDHEDPSCAIFHRLYYAMFDARAAIAKATQ
ncbi:hypothetical protein BLL42_21240 [Pseudomonas frederiksbergensis]|uniref:Uncharacterized protein n=1 Tax=Pseudomonas frederiksbergensis TaxID=104087 RepID=A0A1J0EQ38_9PSED|nr:hypothetical protein [Pseudomonas frederiksbergensis]APC18126.1 hypothetical protein BLL42_21240 [Pseudomonas frederiksbergensis]